MYRNEKYEKCYNLLNKYATSDTITENILLIMGICRMELNDPTSALSYFNRIIENKGNFFLDHALWYSALAEIKMKDNRAAIGFLEMITKDPNADHYQEAFELYKRLK
jgi:tetratricopeptide (TPR) repeat protein